MISIVVPVFNEARTIRELHRRIVDVMRGQTVPYEIIFIDDASTDDTHKKIENLRPLKIVFLQRNCGETIALDVGIQEAKGDIIVLLDADLQNDPIEIPKFLQKISEGCDVVAGWRKERKDRWSRIFFSRLANFAARIVLDVPLHDFGCGLKAYRSGFIKDFRLFGDAQASLPAIAKERGAKICEISVSHQFREFGESKTNIPKMIKTGFDLLSVVFFIRYFSRPLRFFGGWGAVSIFLSVLAFVVAIILRLFGIEDFTATPLPVVGTLFAILGVLLFMMGLLAEILLPIYYASTNHSPYSIREIKENKLNEEN